MATLQIATAFVESEALRKRSSLGAARGFQGRKTLRVSCQQNPAHVNGRRSGSESDGDQVAVKILQSSRNPLLNLPREDLMAALFENDNQVDGAVSTVGFVRPAASAPRQQSERVIFTAEKARLLRKESRAAQTFHDKWYHSAIAAKLAMPED